ncbi:hypothetical protein SDC9_168915 [bioreactor metagenome]|uniref:Uncharacterized protein n=1 Tax=bioreactor metagenome TaxID=1076179 RepID=A0A645G4F6_9ZZZZ
MQHAVCHSEGIVYGGLFVGDAEQPVVRNDDQRVDLVAQLHDAGIRLPYPPAPLKGEGQRNDRHHERSRLFGDPGDDRSRPCACAAAHPGGDEYHIRTLDHGAQLLARLHRRLVADLWIGTGSEALRQLFAE